MLKCYKSNIDCKLFFYSLRNVLTIHIDLLSGDDGDSMVVPGAHHPINQTPLSGAGLELQDLIVADVGVGIISS